MQIDVCWHPTFEKPLLLVVEHPNPYPTAIRLFSFVEGVLPIEILQVPYWFGNSGFPQKRLFHNAIHGPIGPRNCCPYFLILHYATRILLS